MIGDMDTPPCRQNNQDGATREKEENGTYETCDGKPLYRDYQGGASRPRLDSLIFCFFPASFSRGLEMGSHHVPARNIYVRIKRTVVYVYLQQAVHKRPDRR